MSASAKVKRGAQKIVDPKTYAEMSVPHASRAAFNEAMAGFETELRALRVKYKVRDLVYVIADEVEGDGSIMTRGSCGDTGLIITLLACAYGQERANVMNDHDEAVRRAEKATLARLKAEAEAE